MTFRHTRSLGALALLAACALPVSAQIKMKTMAYIGFSDALGEAFYAGFEKFAAVRKISIVAHGRSGQGPGAGLREAL